MDPHTKHILASEAYRRGAAHRNEVAEKDGNTSSEEDECHGTLQNFRKIFFGYEFPDVVYSTCENLIIQGAIKLNRGGHEVYVDDSLLVLQGTLWRSKQHLGFHSQHNGLVGHQAEPG